jgi:thioredoxin reductase (NADPH)
MPTEPLDCVIIGAGPAGLTAATYLARFRRHVAVLSSGRSRAEYIPVTHNCPGFPFGISGAELLAKLGRQATSFGAIVVNALVERIERDQTFFTLRASGTVWHARTVILAAGIVDRLPPIQNIEKGIADSVVRICAICDGYEAKNHRIAVYGPAPALARHARFLRTYSETVTAILSEPEAATEPASLPEASWEDERRRLQEMRVQVRPVPRSLELLPADGTPGAERNKVTGCRATWADDSEDYDSLYPVLGAEPKASLATRLGAEVDANGELLVNAHLETSVDSLYAAGDVVSALNQIAVATGHGAIAASAVHGRLPANPM